MFKFLAAVLALVPMLSFADTKGGGGGIGIACYKGEELVSVELLDLYEARTLGLKLTTKLSEDVAKDTELIAKKIYKSNSETNKVLDIMKKYRAIMPDSELTLTNDALPVFLPRDCKVKQVANYYNDNLIWIDQVLYDKMDYLNKLALAFHEHIYVEERRLGIPDSRYTRVIVGWAFSTEDPFDTIRTDRASAKLCKSADEKTVFLATKVKNPRNTWRFDFIRLNGHKIFAPKHGEFYIADVSPLGDYRQETSSQGARAVLHGSTYLFSKINDKEVMGHYSDDETLSLSWTGTDPGDKFTNVKVSCE